jgi:hypothetical protein
MSPNWAPLDALNLLFLPLMVVTAGQCYKHWGSLWDAELTAADRQLLQQAVIFVLLPVVVLCHELGHVAAIKFFGGTIKEFHYAFQSGYVVPGQSFPPDQTIWLYFSGNLVQILMGVAAGLLALLSNSPPIVAMLVYLALWSVGGTVIVYALLSLTGLYGDWINIYSYGLSPLVLAIGAFQLTMAALVFWCLYGELPKFWFIGKVNHSWRDEVTQLKEQVTRYPSAENWLHLAWSCFGQGLFRTSERFLSKAGQLAPESPAVKILEATTADRKGNLDYAIECYERLAELNSLPARQREVILLELANCQSKQGNAIAALKTYNQAVVESPHLADPHYYRGVLLGNAGQFHEAEAELKMSLLLEWLDKSLPSTVPARLLSIKTKQLPKQ